MLKISQGLRRKGLFPSGTHLEVMKGTPKQSQTYCSKVESRVTGPGAISHERGDCPSQGKRVDITELLEYAKTHSMSQCWVKYPERMFQGHRSVAAYRMSLAQVPQMSRPSVKVFHGPTGTGKSHQAMMGASGGAGGVFGDRAFYSMMTPSDKHATPWIDGYEGQEDVVLEDFSGSIAYRLLLRMLDQYPNKMQVKGGMVEFNPKRIWISSNLHPRLWYPEETYEGGPLERRLEGDSTGTITRMDVVWVPPLLLIEGVMDTE